MLASLNLLNRFVSLPRMPPPTSEFVSRPFDVALIRSLLTRQGFEVESATAIGLGFEQVVVGQIVDARPHPQADRLKICKVNVGDSSHRQIVCGAQNARDGLFVAVALPGAKLPGGICIEETAIRGVDSRGMLCARQELGLETIACDGEGIWELDRDESCGQSAAKLAARLGWPVFDALGLRDVILDVSVTPNRPDALCHLGIAREIFVGLSHLNEKAHEVVWHGVSWLLDLSLQSDGQSMSEQIFQPLGAQPSTQPEAGDTHIEKVTKHLGLQLLDEAAKLASSGAGSAECQVGEISFRETKFRAENELGVPAFFMGVENVKTKASPAWLRAALEALGQNSVNDVVDLSNFILLCLGQPSHAFDLKKLGSNPEARLRVLVLRRACSGFGDSALEKFTGLDGKKRDLHPDDCVVASYDDFTSAPGAQTVQALLGVLGGELSKVDATTQSMVVEWANPEPVPVRRASRRIGRKTDSSFQFEKGLDRAYRHEAAALFWEIFRKLQPEARLCGVVPSVTVSRVPNAQPKACIDLLPYLMNAQMEHKRPDALEPFKNVLSKQFPALLGILNENAAASSPVSLNALSLFEKPQKDIVWSRSSLESFTGASICSWEAQLLLLRRLGFQFSDAQLGPALAVFLGVDEVQNLQRVRIHVPHWRLLDISGEADISEEIVRVVGLDLVPGQPMVKPLQARKDDGHLQMLEAVASTLTYQGYTEVTSFHFMKENDLENLGLADLNSLGVPVRLLNPIIADEPLMNTTLLPDLLRKAKRNINYGTKSGQLFHISRTYQNMDFSGKIVFNTGTESVEQMRQSALRQLPDSSYASARGFAYSSEEAAGHRPVETPRLAGLAFGEREEKSWNLVSGRPWILHDFIGHVFDLAARLTVKIEIERLISAEQCPMFPALHPGKSVLVSGMKRDGSKTPLGFIGEMHPRALRRFEVDAAAFAFELNLAELYRLHTEHSFRDRPHYSVHRLPLVHRDFAFLLDARTPAIQVQKVVESALSQLIETEKVGCRLAQFKVFDVYLGSTIPQGKKSMAFQISLEPLQETLSDEIIQKISTEVVRALELGMGASLR